MTGHATPHHNLIGASRSYVQGNAASTNPGHVAFVIHQRHPTP